jgi:PAS domain S-box-containing protein
MNHSISKSGKLDPLGVLLETVKEYAISIVDLNGFIVRSNDGAQQLSGYTADEIVGQHFSKMYSSEHIESDKFREVLFQVIRDGRLEQESCRRRKDGSRFWASIVFMALRDQSGMVQGFVEITRQIAEPEGIASVHKRAHGLGKDIEERTTTPGEFRDSQIEMRVKERTSELCATIAKLEKANRLKDDFLATVSHELLTPLASATGWIKMIRGARLSPAQVEHGLQVVERSLATQKELVEDLMNVTRVLSGKLTIHPQPVNPASIIGDTIESLQPSIASKQLQIEAELEVQVDTIQVDPVRFQQIVWNLLTNAVKFTPPGGLIRVQLKRGETQVILSVSDTGKGIPREFLPYVFDRYRQAESSRSERYGGLGLGMSIVRHLVELHGGAVSVNSRGEGQGSTFSVHLPVPAVPQEPAPQRGCGAVWPTRIGTIIDISSV